MALHVEITRRLEGFYRSNRIPNLLFHGAHGTGKRTLVYNFIDLIYDNQKDTQRSKIKTNVMFVNCAHGKGIKFIREELKFFAKTNIKGGASDVRFKTIVLFNADSLTIDAQSALRRCIELFSYNTRFFIVVENKHRLLNPIVSRFCEIYVPETTQNLHRQNIEKVYCGGRKREGPCKWPPTSESWWNEDRLLQPLLETVNAAYEHGQSSLDLIEWIRTEKSDCVDVVMHFYRIKAEYRCEKLLMFCILSRLR
jgi:Cdc6-like AAA superfamily ATPase